MMQLTRPIAPIWILRASFTSGASAVIHLFDGLRAACGRRPETSAYRHPALVLHDPATAPTCLHCLANSDRDVTARPTGAELDRAAAQMTALALTSGDQHQALAALRLLAAPPALAPLADAVAACPDPPPSRPGATLSCPPPPPPSPSPPSRPGTWSSATTSSPAF
ncbi:hypothetical protein GTY54_41575 [Streptomyces sp. SID625]|nr:hypothetical protein [Streptomyces sp. SID625]MYR62426.1 hypothetical protein [Streptomyces sp. SID625]